MKLVIKKYFIISLLLLLTSTIQSFAQPNLPVSSQTNDNDSEIEDEIEIIPEIKISAELSTTQTNTNLKDGKACSNEDLEEVKGEIFVDIPMAETIPCQGDECKDLKPARMENDNYKQLKDAETIKCGD